MNVCVKTGAYVRFEEYGSFAPADLYLIGNAIAVRFMPEGEVYQPSREVTHEITIGNAGWFRRDIGVAVVPLANVTGPLCMGVGTDIEAQELARNINTMGVMAR